MIVLQTYDLFGGRCFNIEDMIDIVERYIYERKGIIVDIMLRKSVLNDDLNKLGRAFNIACKYYMDRGLLIVM